MARTANIIKPTISHGAANKLLACLNWSIGKFKRKGVDPTYTAAPGYYDACLQWYQRLSDDQQETADIIVDAYSFPDRRKAVETWAAALPAAPKYPL